MKCLDMGARRERAKRARSLYNITQTINLCKHFAVCNVTCPLAARCTLDLIELLI